MMQTTHDRLEVRHLRLVQAVAREGSVTRAAAVLHLSQSAVSHQLVDLERELGTRLFDRVGKKMVLTSAGARMVEASDRLLRDLSALERELLEHRRDARTSLRVTTSCYTSYHWLPEALEHFGQKHPRVDLSIVLEATKRATEALIEDEVDMAIVNEPPRNEALAHLDILDSELVVVARRDHEVLKRSPAGVRFYDLRGQTVLVFEGASEVLLTRLTEAVRESWFRKTGERLANPVTIRKVPISEVIMSLARAGTGVAIVDRWLTAGYLDRSVVARPLQPTVVRKFYAAFRKSNPRNLPIEALVKVIRGTANTTARTR
jgi:LysR family transcriptional regulator for metE and metH